MRDGLPLILVCEFLLLFSGHWLPWRVIPALVDEYGSLRRVPSYIYGTGCIFAGFATWASIYAERQQVVAVWHPVLVLASLMTAAGLGTIAPRGLRAIIEWRAQIADLKDRHGTPKR